MKRSGDLPVPLHLRNAPTKLMKEIGYGEKYQYSHDFAGHVSDQEFLPEAISGKRLYEPGDNRKEQEFAAYLRSVWKERYGT